MSVEVRAVYMGGLRVDATHGPSGTKLNSDAPVDNGGNGDSFSPTDLVATALATCVLTIMGLFGDRHQIAFAGAHIKVTKEMITKPVRRIGALRTVVTIPAGSIDDAKLRERMEAAAHRCPVHQSLHPEIDAPIEFVYE